MNRSDDTKPRRPDAETRRQAEALGVSPECLPPEDEDEDEGGPMVEVFRDNWASVKFFLACETQWRMTGTMAALFWVGIDYVAAAVILRHRSRDERREKPAADLLADLALMEGAARKILNKARS